MTQNEDIRRLRNGAIDIDFYRTGATALRRQAMREAFRLKVGFGVGLVMVAMLSFATMMASTHQGGDTAVQMAGEWPRFGERGTPTFFWLGRFVQIADPTVE